MRLRPSSYPSALVEAEVNSSFFESVDSETLANLEVSPVFNLRGDHEDQILVVLVDELYIVAHHIVGGCDVDWSGPEFRGVDWGRPCSDLLGRGRGGDPTSYRLGSTDGAFDEPDDKQQDSYCHQDSR